MVVSGQGKFPYSFAPTLGHGSTQFMHPLIIKYHNNSGIEVIDTAPGIHKAHKRFKNVGHASALQRETTMSRYDDVYKVCVQPQLSFEVVKDGISPNKSYLPVRL